MVSIIDLGKIVLSSFRRSLTVNLSEKEEKYWDGGALAVEGTSKTTKPRKGTSQCFIGLDGSQDRRSPVQPTSRGHPAVVVPSIHPSGVLKVQKPKALKALKGTHEN